MHSTLLTWSSSQTVVLACHRRVVGTSGSNHSQKFQYKMEQQPCHDQTAAQAVADSTVRAAQGSPPKRRRTEWEWQCPACSNKHSTSALLLRHMRKCCADLLPSNLWQQEPHQVGLSDLHSKTGLLQQQQQQEQLQQQQQGLISAQQQFSAQQQLMVEGAAASDDQQLRKLLTDAEQAEHTLRMKVLRLRFIQDTSQHQQPHGASADAALDEEDVDDADSRHPSLPQGLNSAVQPSPTAAAVAAAATAAAAPTNSAQQGRNKVAAGQIRRRSRSSGRLAVRTIEQIMAELQLPHSRVLKLLERAPRSIRLVADNDPLSVVYEDQQFLVVSKPPGLRSAPVHRFMGGSAVNRMIGYLGYEPHLLHRLDMDTSGVLLAAKDPPTASAVNAQFRDKLVRKAYLAICLGVPQQQSFKVCGPIGLHPEVTVARQVAPDGLPATTFVQVVSVSSTVPESLVKSEATSEPGGGLPGGVQWGPAAAVDLATRVQGTGCCLVCCRPATGRTHQIRVHMAHSGHPLLGDDVYGLQGPWIGRQALHAMSLSLQHPDSRELVTFVAPPPADFVAAAEVLGLAVPDLESIATGRVTAEDGEAEQGMQE